MSKEIFYIDILKNDVYVEYSTREFEYVSFTKAKKLIKEHRPKTLPYFCTDHRRSVDFLNSLSTIYNNKGNKLELIQT